MTSTPIQRFLTALHSTTGNEAKQNGKGWSACCPAHEDARPSLSIAEGDRGQVLLNCHANKGCMVDAICGAVGLRVADLMPVDGVDVDKTEKSPRKRRDVSTSKVVRTYQTAEAAIEALERKRGKPSALWTYHDAQDAPVGVIVRWDKAGEKEIRPVARHGDEWVIGGMPEPRPLYCLPELESANRVFITEGEKAADAARRIGLIVTTSSHGSQSPDKTDWTPLAGKECVILPDQDEAGGEYAYAVSAILAKLMPPAVVKVVELPELPNQGDIADWVEAQPDVGAHELRLQVEALADQADVIQSGRVAVRIECFQPFPTEALPEPVRGLVVAGAKAIGCDPSYVALPMLTALAAAIGNTRRIQLKRGWTAPAIIWIAIVGESGTAKTPAFKLVMYPIRERQRKALERHADAMRQHEADLAHYEKALAEWKRDKKTTDEPPAKPESPQAERCIVSDTTVEALAPLLLANPRGLLLARDELAGWIGSFDRYAGGKGGADAAHWLSMHNGESILVDRKTGNPRTIYVPMASVSVCGGIQPTILHRALGVAHRESGLAARLLLTCPPRKPKRWTEADIDPTAEAEIARLVDRLYELQPTNGDDGEPRPVVIGLTHDAKAVWKAFFNSHAQEHVDLAGELSAAWSKLEEYAARLALVIHYARWAADDPELRRADVVDAASMLAGVKLAQWFKGEALRVYSLLRETDDDRERRRLFELIQRKGGSVTARDLMRSSRQWATAAVAETALDDLAKAGHGEWVEQPTSSKGGRPTRVFVLPDIADVDTTPTKPSENSSSVNVNGVNGPNDDWGEL
jgi:hypothetical protein